MSPTVVWDHCLFEQDCEAVAIDWGMKFRADDNFATKGCFTKNGKAFFAPGTEAEMKMVNLSGTKEHLYCPSSHQSGP